MTRSSKGVILIVDDEPLKRVTLQIELTEAGYTVHEAPDAGAALEQIATLGPEHVDVIVTDLRMPGMNGLEFIEKIKAQRADIPVVVMTAYGSIDSAVEAMKHGAYDYLTKPFATEVLLEKLDRLRAGQLSSGSVSAHTGPTPKAAKRPVFVGTSAAISGLRDQLQTIAVNEDHVLVQGESGTGRRLAAETIHALSSRSMGPMIRMDCAAKGDGTLSVEIFGHVGSETGSPRRPGQLERADHGTLLIEDVDMLSPDLQTKLLRFIQDGVVDRSQDGQPISMDVRIMGITAKPLPQLADDAGFRQDLYQHLSRSRVAIPPMRERRDDIPVLANHFLSTAQPAANDGNCLRIHPNAMDLLMTYHWPGNVAELKQVIEQAVASAVGDEIAPRDVSLPATRKTEADRPQVFPEEAAAAGLTQTVAGVERTLIDAALRRAAGNQAKAAQFLRIPRTTLRDKMAKYGMVGTPNHKVLTGV